MRKYREIDFLFKTICWSIRLRHLCGDWFLECGHVQNRIITKLCKQSTAGRFLGKLAANL